MGRLALDATAVCADEGTEVHHNILWPLQHTLHLLTAPEEQGSQDSGANWADQPGLPGCRILRIYDCPAGAAEPSIFCHVLLQDSCSPLRVGNACRYEQYNRSNYPASS